MPSTTAERSLGASIGFGDAQGGPYNTIARVRDFKAPTSLLNLFDATAHDNDSGFEEMVASLLRRSEELTFKCSYIHDDATQDHLTGLIYLRDSATKKDWQVEANAEMGNVKWQFAGYVTKIDGPTLPVDGISEMDVTIKPTDYMETTL